MELVFHEDTLPRIKAYPSLMYRDLKEPENSGLRTGDVIKLNLNDFKKVLRNYQSFRPLLEQFLADPKYKAGLWTVLNKPCDMVHDGQGRSFDTNLFLCPMQSLMSELKPGGIFKQYVKTPAALQTYKETLNELLVTHINVYLKKAIPLSQGLTDAQKVKVNTEKDELRVILLSTIDNQIFDFLEETIEPEDIEGVFKQYSEREGNLHEVVRPFFLNLITNRDWIKYKTLREQTIKSSSNVEISRDGLKKINELFLNQQDARGIFYFEPAVELVSKEVNDFSFFIEVEDMLTLKIDESSIQNGSFYSLLIEKRLCGLTRNFSDRLQNIMGNYFSKIGTADVKTMPVLTLYSECFERFSFGSST